jgi:hypothetical protein
MSAPLRHEPGWAGAFTRGTAEGALPNGSLVIKANAEPGDGHPDGTPGVVLGSIIHPDVMDGQLAYFVEWAPRPRTAIVTVADKLRPAQG